MTKKYYGKGKTSKFEKSQKAHAKLAVQNQAKSIYHANCFHEQNRTNRVLSKTIKKNIFETALYRANDL